MGVDSDGIAIRKKGKPSVESMYTVNMPREGCLILCPLCNVCISGDGQVLANNKNYLKLENANHSHWNLARIFVLFHFVLTPMMLSTYL